MEFLSKSRLKSVFSKSQGRTSGTAIVSAAELITPHMRRITFSGQNIGVFAEGGPAHWVKILFPADGGGRLLGRTYTVRRCDPKAGSLDIDFVLHGRTGPASTWAEDATIGDCVEIAGSRPGPVIRADTDWRLLAGDETALSAIATILETVSQKDRPRVIIEVPTPEDEQLLVVPGIEILWLPRSEHKTPPGTLLADTICDTPLPSGDGQVFVAGEARAVRRIRDRMAPLITADKIETKEYWSLGQADYRD